MHHPDDPFSPGERAGRRRLFTPRPSAPATPEPPNALDRIEEMTASIRSLIAHSDERFQALAARTARLEDTLNLVADSVRDAKAQLAEGIGQFGAPIAYGDAVALRAQLADITREIAGALQTLAERDQEVVEAVRSRILEHGQLITSETTRISRAMESYVQHGVEAIGQLAGSMETQVHALATRDEDIAERIGEAIDRQITVLGEQLQLMYERMAIDTVSITEVITDQGQRDAERAKALSEYANHVNERIDVARRDILDELNRGLSSRVMGLARLVRSDAEALRREIVRTAETHDEKVAAIVDERLSRVTHEVDAGARTLAEELMRRIALEQQRVIDGRMDEHAQRIEGRMDEYARRIEGRVDGVVAAIDERTSERLSAIGGGIDQAVGAIDERLAEKMAALARLVRSDNETLAEQIAAGQNAAKQTLRALKELQANLPSDVIEMVEQRLASLAETIERSNETLTKRIDKMTDAIGKRHDNDIQVVIDRMGDAMHALASLGRSEPAEERLRSQGRIEIE
jgi:ABC-type transporter Mla subunit MlaD